MILTFCVKHIGVFFLGEEADVFERTNCLIVGKQITKLPIKAAPQDARKGQCFAIHY